MLKVLPNTHFKMGNAKCAEIYCSTVSDFRNFTILCSFCEMKIFEFGDFLLHFKNMHFEETENIEIKCKALYPECSIKNEEDNVDDIENETSWLEEAKNENEDDHPVIQDEKIMKWQNNALFEEEATWSAPSNNDDGDYNVDSNEDCDDEADKDYKPKLIIKKQMKKEIKEYPCENCDRIYKSYHQYRLHKVKCSASLIKIGTTTVIPTTATTSTATILKCNQCSAEFKTQYRLNIHLRKEHFEIKCTQCNKKFKQRYLLKRHEVIHSGVKNFVCDYENCDKRFYSKRHLTAHKHIHFDLKNFVCDICGYSCRCNSMLVIHYRTHTGEKPFSCNVCKKSFASTSLLSEHKATHSTDRTSICDVCGAAFSRPKALYHHKHLHLGIKKFKCKICGKAYAQAAGLAGHVRKHKEEMF